MSSYGVKGSLCIVYETTWTITVTYFSKHFRKSRELVKLCAILTGICIIVKTCKDYHTLYD
jgi:hypothetical protein